MTAAIVLDDAIERKRENGKWVEVNHKRQPEELKNISDLAQAAIGFNGARGDVISVENMSFDHGVPVEITPPSLAEKAKKGIDDYSSVVRYGVILTLFFLVYMLTIRPIQKRVLSGPNPLLAAALAQRTEPEIAPVTETAASLAARSATLKKQLAEFVKAEPDNSTTAVRAWLREEAQ
jgi:flagellar M-ring protein FliF